MEVIKLLSKETLGVDVKIDLFKASVELIKEQLKLKKEICNHV